MPQYHVTWEIDVDGRHPVEAAKRCQQTQRNQFSLANVFTVYNEQSGVTYLIDLDLETLTFIPPKSAKKTKKVLKAKKAKKK